MLIIPAIDLESGFVVRLTQGRKDKKVYSKDPVKTAKHWVRQGAGLIHIVDLDGARCGILKNLDIVKSIIKNIDIPVQFGGGVRNAETIKALFNAGIYRVVLGTKAVEDRNFLKNVFKAFKTKVIVSVDAKADEVLINGWQAKSTGSGGILDFVCKLKEIGFKEFIYTDTLKDGTLLGPNIKSIKTLLKKTGVRIIASGGVSSLDDIGKLKSLEKDGLRGIIIGKALYEGRFTLSQALKLA